MKKRLLSILLMCCMVLTLLPTTAFAESGTEESSACTCETACTAESMNTDCPVCGAEGADLENCKCATVESEQKVAPISTSSFPTEDLVDPVIRINLSSDDGGNYAIENGKNCTRTAADFFQSGKAPKGAKITAVTPPTSPSIPVSVKVDSDGTLRCTKAENTTEPVPKSETYTVTITSDDYAPITALLTVRQYLNAGFQGPIRFGYYLYGDTYTYTCRVNNPGTNGVWSALIQDPEVFEIYQETTDTTSEPGKSIYTVHIRAIKASARVTWIDFLYFSDTTLASSKDSSTVITGGTVSTRPLTVTADSATITKGDALPTELVTCTGLLESEGRTDDRDTVLDNALGYQLLDANNEEVAADTARNTPGTYTVVPAATLKSGWDERYSLNRVNGTLTVEDKVEEQFTLTPGGRYYFDLSAMNIPGTANSNLPDSTLHYVPFTYVGTVNAYSLKNEADNDTTSYEHSLFIANYNVTHTVSWNDLNTAGLIFGKDYVGGGVDYTLRAPSVGSNSTGSGDSQRGTPQSNEWDAVLNKNSGYIQNWNIRFSWGQDTYSGNASYRAFRGHNSARGWDGYNAAGSYPHVGFRPVLEILNADTLGSDGLKVVTLDLGGGTLGGSSDAIQIIVKNGSDFTAPASDGMTRPDGDTGNFFMWRGSNGKFYVPGDSVPADVTALTGQWTAPTYTVTLHANGGTINSGNVTGYTYGVGATLPTADDMTYTGHTFKGWYDNESLTGSPVTAIGDTETGNKEYWAKWEINQYTVTVKPENGKADITITQDYGTPITAPTLTREGYQFNGWDKAFPTTMPAEDLTITAQWRDIAVPTGEIKIAENDWKSFLNTITFGLFFKDTQTVTVTATDNSGETVTIEYLLSEKALAESELAGMTFTAYSAPFSINPDNEYVIYAKLTDTSGNVAYINTNGIVLDATVPGISGIADGKTYCAAQTITVDEKYIGTVKVNGTEVSLDKNSQFALSPASGEQTIVVTDKAGNETRVTVTVNDGHTYEWQNENGQYWQKCKFCNHETAKKDIPTINISGADKVCRTQDYKFSFTLPEGATGAAYGYKFIGFGDGPLTPTVENGLYSGIIKASTYPAKENSFKLIVSAKTADGFEFSAEKKVTIQNEHSGGTSTCIEQATCEICGEKYGDLKPHSYSPDWSTDETNHWHECTECRAKTDEAEHTDGNKDHKCDVCEKILSECTDTNKDHKCDLCGKTLSEHSGGKATCKDKAKCEFCGESYGELNVNNHSDLKHFPAVAATKTAEGNIEYWYCSGCKKYYKDAAATQEIKQADTVTAKRPSGTITPGADKSPQTGDNSNLLLWIALLFISGGAVTATTVYGRKKKRSVK